MKQVIIFVLVIAILVLAYLTFNSQLDTDNPVNQLTQQTDQIDESQQMSDGPRTLELNNVADTDNIIHPSSFHDGIVNEESAWDFVINTDLTEIDVICYASKILSRFGEEDDLVINTEPVFNATVVNSLDINVDFTPTEGTASDEYYKIECQAQTLDGELMGKPAAHLFKVI